MWAVKKPEELLQLRENVVQITVESEDLSIKKRMRQTAEDIGTHRWQSNCQLPCRICRGRQIRASVKKADAAKKTE